MSNGTSTSDQRFNLNQVGMVGEPFSDTTDFIDATTSNPFDLTGCTGKLFVENAAGTILAQTDNIGDVSKGQLYFYMRSSEYLGLAVGSYIFRAVIYDTNALPQTFKRGTRQILKP